MNNPAPHPTQKPARPRPSFLRIIAIVILILIILFGLAVLITWLSIRPKHLVYIVEEASIHNFNIDNSNRLNSTFDFVVRAHNPNTRVSIYYDSIEARVEYDDQILARDAVPPFFQSHKNVSRLEVKLKSQSVALFGSVPKDLKLERSSGEVELSVAMKARVRLKVGAWKSHHMKLKVYCSPVLVRFSSNVTFQRTHCDAELWAEKTTKHQCLHFLLFEFLGLFLLLILVVVQLLSVCVWPYCLCIKLVL